MNKNTKRRLTQYAKDNKGKFAKPVYKKKAKPFPQPNKEATLSLLDQRAFLGWDKTK
jgi:hypothetical protein